MQSRPYASGVLAAIVASSCATQPAPQGPLPVRNQHPAQLLVMHMPPASTRGLAAGEVSARADAAYSSLWLVGAAPGRQWRMDAEYLRVAAGLRVGIGSGLDLAVELPVAHTSGGFLDSFLVDYHDFFGLPDQDRDISPRNAYDVSLRRCGNPGWSADPAGAQLLDVPIYASWRLTPERAPVGFAVRGGVELPTGDADRGYGSGGVEPSLGVLFDREGDLVSLYGHAQYTWVHTPDEPARAGFAFADVAVAGLAAEIALLDDLHGFVQVAWETSTLRNFGLRETDDDQALLWVGGRLRCSDALQVELGFGEDLLALVSPDFTAWLGMVWQPSSWGRSRRLGLPR
ncbi:MAG: DUF3187 family protein [Planctomycetota bacterium]